MIKVFIPQIKGKDKTQVRGFWYSQETKRHFCGRNFLAAVDGRSPRPHYVNPCLTTLVCVLGGLCGDNKCRLIVFDLTVCVS
jgi:hypothetical protein